jgi:hypothetical protein
VTASLSSSLFQLASSTAGPESRALVNPALDIPQEASANRFGPVPPAGPQGARKASARALFVPLVPERGGAPAAVLGERVLRALGREERGGRWQTRHNLALHAVARISAEPRLELMTEPPLTSVRFRYLPISTDDVDAFNGTLRRRVVCEGRTLLARSHPPAPGGRNEVHLKLMLLDPATTSEQLDQVTDELLAVAPEQAAVTSTD